MTEPRKRGKAVIDFISATTKRESQSLGVKCDIVTSFKLKSLMSYVAGRKCLVKLELVVKLFRITIFSDHFLIKNKQKNKSM